MEDLIIIGAAPAGLTGRRSLWPQHWFLPSVVAAAQDALRVRHRRAVTRGAFPPALQTNDS